MKFLLAAINAKYIHSNPAVYSLRAYAGEALRPYAELAEYTINQSLQEILGDIYDRKPDVIGFSCYIWNWRLVQELVEELPKILPGVRLWLGGPEVSYDAHVILEKFPQLAGIMVGEGEATFRELLEYYMDSVRNSPDGNLCGEGEENQKREALQKIRGLCLREGYTPSRPPVNMNDLPFLYHNPETFQNRIIYYEASRGCPFRCSYCLSSVERQIRIRDISVVKEELQFFLDNRVKQVKFVDRTFNCNHDFSMAVWQYLLENDNGVTNFHFEISADILQEDQIALLGRLRAGLVQLEIGVQSANPMTLKAIRRSTDLEKLERAVEAIRRGKNVHQHLDLIAGLPYEDFDSFGESFNRVYRMSPEQLQLGFLKVLKGSEMWERAEEWGIVYREQPPYEVLYTRWVPYDQMRKLKHMEEMVEIYYNSAQFTHTMRFLENAFPHPFAMYEALADFYEEKGYFAVSPARARRYEILSAFAARWDKEREPVYRELLTYDMYLRENLKSRPEFAGELAPVRKQVRDFYQREERERRFLPEYAQYDWKQLEKMTHLEPFNYPVWDRERMAAGYEGGEGKEWGTCTRFVLFDYRKRNPLNYEAHVQVIEE